MELLDEIKEGTVDFRPNYDGTTEEPIVLPARVPQLLANGCSGIAVGMATNIPPHNLSEVCQAAIALLDNRKLECKDLLKYIKGPDFPTGGLCTNSKKELREIYETGQGPIHLRGEWKTEETKKGSPLIILTSIPYNVSKADLVEKIAEVIINKKLPMLVDVRDESTAEVRIVLELKQGADPALVMAYLYKHTPIELSFHVNMTCLVPTQNREVAGPMRLNLCSILSEFLDFREEVVRRRFEFELAELRRRIHILEGFAIVFDALDEAIRIIRKSDGKADAAGKIIKRFGLDEEQTDAILELKLYKLARLEIQVILDELGAKQARAKEIETILKDKRKLWGVIRGELREIAEKFTDKRRTKIGGGGGEDIEFQAEDFIVDEEVTVILSRDGWLKRVKEIKDLSTTRVREGDAVLTALRGSTKEFMAIFSNFGSCYVLRINDVPASTGYGEPVQKLFNFRDGERVIAAYVVTGTGPSVLPADGQIIAVTKHGFGFRLNPDPHREISTRAGRRYAKLEEGDEVVNVLPFKPKEVICMVTAQTRTLMCKADEAAELANPGKGVTMIKVEDDDVVVGFAVGDRYGDELLIAELDNGKKVSMGPGHDQVTSRGGKGHTLARKAKVVRVLYPESEPDPKQVN
jgi:DNA gyrase subunit A